MSILFTILLPMLDISMGKPSSNLCCWCTNQKDDSFSEKVPLLPPPPLFFFSLLIPSSIVLCPMCTAQEAADQIGWVNHDS